jgi:hypothetical protein
MLAPPAGIAFELRGKIAEIQPGEPRRPGTVAASVHAMATEAGARPARITAAQRHQLPGFDKSIRCGPIRHAAPGEDKQGKHGDRSPSNGYSHVHRASGTYRGEIGSETMP